MLYAKWWPCFLGLNALMMIRLQKQRSKIVIYLMLLKWLHELKVVLSSKFSVNAPITPVRALVPILDFVQIVR